MGDEIYGRICIDFISTDNVPFLRLSDEFTSTVLFFVHFLYMIFHSNVVKDFIYLLAHTSKGSGRQNEKQAPH